MSCPTSAAISTPLGLGRIGARGLHTMHVTAVEVPPEAEQKSSPVISLVLMMSHFAGLRQQQSSVIQTCTRRSSHRPRW